MKVSSSIHVLQIALFCSFLWLSRIPLCMCTVEYDLIHSFVEGHLGCFHVLAIENSAAVTIGGACIFFNESFVWVYAQGGTAGSYGSFVFSFLRYLHTVFCSAYTSFIPNSEGGFPFLHTLSSICYLWTC